MKNIRIFQGITLVSLLSFTGCAAPPSSPAEKFARIGVGAEVAVQRCSAYVGGYDAAKAMKADSAKSLEAARKLGATPEMITKARSDVSGTLQGAVIMIGEREACSQFLTSLAFAGS